MTKRAAMPVWARVVPDPLKSQTKHNEEMKMSKSKKAFVFELRSFSFQDDNDCETVLQAGQIFSTWATAKAAAQMDYFDATMEKGKLQWAEVNNGFEWQAGDPEVWLYRITKVPVNCAFVR